MVAAEAEFIAAYGPLPANAILFVYPQFVIDANEVLPFGSLSMTLTDGDGGFIDAIDVPSGITQGQSVNFPLDGAATLADPTPRDAGLVEPEPPIINEIIDTDGIDSLTGTNGDDLMIGGASGGNLSGRSGNDTIDGGAQSDILSGNKGDDEIYGGLGNDSINGGQDEDLIYGGSNNDRINGGADDDEIYGEHGRDNLFGSGGDDLIFGGKSADRIFGGADNDELYGGEGRDRVDGGAGNDLVDGGAQRDALFGGTGDDIMIAGLGNDHMTGGTGADTFVFEGVTNNDRILDFEVGVDKIDLVGLGPLELGLDITIEQTGDNVRIELLGSNTLILQGVNVADLSESDSIYIPDDIFIAT